MTRKLEELFDLDPAEEIQTFKSIRAISDKSCNCHQEKTDNS